jgi:hypothetical protein
MSDTLDLRHIQTLYDLQTALGRFANGTQEGLRAAEAEISRTMDWLRERVNHWQREIEQGRREVARAEAALRRCEAGGYVDEDGHYYPPDCRAEARGLANAVAFLKECEENLQTAKAWRSRVEQAVNEYQREARRLAEIAGGHTEKARAHLRQTAAKYEEVKAAASGVGAVGAAVAAGVVGITAQAASGPQGITWAEKQAILKKIDAGQSITRDELTKLSLPVSDLRAKTLQPDYSWVHQLVEAERFREATRGLWTGEIPQGDTVGQLILKEVESLAGIAADTSKVTQYWKNKE